MRSQWSLPISQTTYAREGSSRAIDGLAAHQRGIAVVSGGQCGIETGTGVTSRPDRGALSLTIVVTLFAVFSQAGETAMLVVGMTGFVTFAALITAGAYMFGIASRSDDSSPSK
ncbi:MAG: hypothetical protein WEB67_09620 [Acidimicrobiia bacterium]